MTDYILEIALRRGIDKIYANVLNMNEYMIGLFKKKDFAFQKVDLESSYVEKKLAQAPATPV